MSQKQWTTLTILGLLVTAICLWVAALAQSHATGAVSQSSSSQSIEPTLSTLSPTEIYTSTYLLTDARKSDYYETLVGKRVHWSGGIGNVTTDNQVYVAPLDRMGLATLILTNVPATTAHSFNMAQQITFTADIIHVEFRKELSSIGGVVITLKLISMD